MFPSRVRSLRARNVNPYRQWQLIPVVPLRMPPSALHEVIWDDGAGRATGHDPYMVFHFRKPQYAWAIRLTCAYDHRVEHYHEVSPSPFRHCEPEGRSNLLIPICRCEERSLRRLRSVPAASNLLIRWVSANNQETASRRALAATCYLFHVVARSVGCDDCEACLWQAISSYRSYSS